VPRVKGGALTLENLAFSCQTCNNYKYTKTEGRDPASGQLAALFNPRRHAWDEHFTWRGLYAYHRPHAHRARVRRGATAESR
jgi:hypothetical protein